MMYTPIRELVGKDLSNLWYIWAMDLNQRLLSVELDPQNVGRFIVSYSEWGKKYTDKNVDGDRYAFRDNSEELERENKQLLEIIAGIEKHITLHLDNRPPEWNAYSITIGEVRYVGGLNEDSKTLAPIIVALRPIAQRKAAAMLASLDADKQGE